MARQVRIEYEGATYHVMCRGDRREAIFVDDEDRRRFLGTLEEAIGKTGWRLHGYVLMTNRRPRFLSDESTLHACRR